MKRSQNKQEKKIVESFIKENYQRDIQQRHCMDRMIRGLIRNIGNNWKKIGDVRKEYKEKEYQK